MVGVFSRAAVVAAASRAGAAAKPPAVGAASALVARAAGRRLTLGQECQVGVARLALGGMVAAAAAVASSSDRNVGDQEPRGRN